MKYFKVTNFILESVLTQTINKSGVTIGEALVALGFTGGMNALQDSRPYLLDMVLRPYVAEKIIAAKLQRSWKNVDWGIYCYDQALARALANTLGCLNAPEVHSSGMYEHYHDANHVIHIWYGGILRY